MMPNMEDNKSPFKEYAEEKVTTALDKNQLILNQAFLIAYNVKEMGKDPKMTARAWQRVWDGVTKSMTGEKVKYQSPIEEAMVSQINNWIGIKVHTIVDNERLLEASKRELANMRDIMEKRKKEAEAGNVEITPAVLPDDKV